MQFLPVMFWKDPLLMREIRKILYNIQYDMDWVLPTLYQLNLTPIPRFIEV